MSVCRVPLILLSALLTGCASSGARVSSIPSALQSTSNSTMGNEGQLIAIRWPVAVEKNARNRLLDNYARFSEVVYAGGAAGQESYDTALELSFAASTYFAAELFQAITRSIPKAHVIMQPTIIKLGEGSRLIEALQVPDDLPATIIVNIADLDGGKFPFLGSMFSYTVRIAPLASQENCGLLLAMEEEFNRSGINKSSSSCTSPNAESAPNPLWYLSFSPNERPAIGFQTEHKLPLSNHSVVIFPPVQLFSMNPLLLVNTPDYVKNSRPMDERDVSGMELHPHLVNLASIISTTSSLTKSNNLGSAPLANYVNTYDSMLSAEIRSGQPLQIKKSDNLNIVKKLLSAELQIRQRRDSKMAASILGGDYGIGFRQQRDKSYQSFNSMMKGSWVSAVKITSSTQTATSPIDVISRNMEMVERHASNLDAIGADLYQQLSPSLDAMESEYLSFEGEKIPLKKSGQRSLRNALKALYAKYKK